MYPTLGIRTYLTVVDFDDIDFVLGSMLAFVSGAQQSVKREVPKDPHYFPILHLSYTAVIRFRIIDKPLLGLSYC